MLKNATNASSNRPNGTSMPYDKPLYNLGLPDNFGIEIEGRPRAQKKLLGKIFSLMFPPLFECRSAYELTCVRRWDKNLPSRLLSALLKRSWHKRLRKLGLVSWRPFSDTSSR